MGEKSSVKIIFDNSRQRSVEVSVIVPIRDDPRVYRLIDALKLQKFKNFEVIFINDAPKPFIDTSKIPKNLNVKIIHSTKPLNIAKKLNVGAKYALGKYYAITETDCVPSKSWLFDTYAYIKTKKNTLLKGNEARNQDVSLANLVFSPSCIKDCPLDEEFHYLSDVQWLRQLNEKGFKIDLKNIGPLYHECYGKGNYWKKTKRHFKDMLEYTYLYLKYPSKDFKKNFTWFLLNQIHGLIVSMIVLVLVVISAPFYFIKARFLKN